MEKNPIGTLQAGEIWIYRRQKVPQTLVFLEHPGLGSEEKVVVSLKGASDWRWQIWSQMGLWQVAI